MRTRACHRISKEQWSQIKTMLDYNSLEEVAAMSPLCYDSVKRIDKSLTFKDFEAQRERKAIMAKGRKQGVKISYVTANTVSNPSFLQRLFPWMYR